MNSASTSLAKWSLGRVWVSDMQVSTLLLPNDNGDVDGDVDDDVDDVFDDGYVDVDDDVDDVFDDDQHEKYHDQVAIPNGWSSTACQPGRWRC